MRMEHPAPWSNTKPAKNTGSQNTFVATLKFNGIHGEISRVFLCALCCSYAYVMHCVIVCAACIRN